MGTHNRTPRPDPAILSDDAGPRPAPDFVEWLMGLPPGWVTDPNLALSYTQQLAALGNVSCQHKPLPHYATFSTMPVSR